MLFMSRKKLLLTIVLIIITALVLYAWSPWDSFRYHGDGKFSDRGFFSYPRHIVTFSDIPLNETSEHHFHFRGMPNEEMRLMLYVKDSPLDTSADRPQLESLPVTIEAVLTDDKGHISCHASGRPGAGNRDQMWVLLSGWGTAFWHYRCINIQVFPNRTYDLAIRVIDVGQGAERVVVTPELTGGGLELP
jgi:hypothetical protein